MPGQCGKERTGPAGLPTRPREALSGNTPLKALNNGRGFFSLKASSMMLFEVKFLLSHLFHQNYTQTQTLTNQDNKSVLLIHLSPIGGHFLICGYVGCIILITLLAFIHGFICFLIFSTKTEASSKTSCKYKRNYF